MYQEMRRKDRQISESEARDLLDKCEYGFLATVNSDNQPYTVPLSYVVLDNQIFIHCATVGQKLENINYEPKVCFTAVGKTQPVFDKNFTTYFESVLVFGKASMVNDDSVKEKALYAIVEKYLPEHMDKAGNAIAGSFKATKVFAITIEHISGKAKKAKPLK